ncbi:DUF6150 family protein [Planctobacterium marinum]|uniref:DUF6150 family protein n=1 Tax=Planctobacterium marinum TaxID=1631968 RepID=UPI001E344F52|nr:DUF6150 family protein [Planctobacterium marinum]MCC2604017.1 DUF6150 family protein [Planctobacterium marinum]
MAKVLQTFNISEANIIATITQEKGKADLCVFIVSSPGMAWSDERWYLTDNEADASSTIYFGQSGRSALKVCFVKNPADAGWQTNHKLKGKI